MTQNNEITIRDARAEDAERIAELVYELEVFEGFADECDCQPDRLRKHLFGDKPYATALVAEGEGRIVGCAIFHRGYAPWRSKPSVYLEVLYVEEAMRSHGVGELLLEWVVALASEANCHQVEWEVIEWNERAMKFYQNRFGAKPVEGWTRYEMDERAIRKRLGRQK